MFRNLKGKLKEFVNKKSPLTETSKINVDDHQDKEIENILSYEESDSLIKLQILRECTFEEYVDAIKKYEKEENSIEIPIRMFITSGGSFIHTKLKKQMIYILSNDNVKYCIVNSSDEVKLSERMFRADEIDEITLNIDKNSKAYTITKYIHDLNYSTKMPKWYPIQDDKLGAFALDKHQAIELFKIFLVNFKKISDMKIFSDAQKLYDLVSSIENSISSDDVEDNLNVDSQPFPEIVDSQIDLIAANQEKKR